MSYLLLLYRQASIELRFSGLKIPEILTRIFTLNFLTIIPSMFITETRTAIEMTEL